jgi:ribosomal protein S27E
MKNNKYVHIVPCKKCKGGQGIMQEDGTNVRCVMCGTNAREE